MNTKRTPFLVTLTLVVCTVLLVGMGCSSTPAKTSSSTTTKAQTTSAVTPTATTTQMKPVTLKFSSALAKTHAVSLFDQQWMDAVTAATGGRVQFQTYFDATLVNGTNSLTSTSSGVTDLANVASIYFPSQLPLTTGVESLFVSKYPDVMQDAFMSVYSSSQALQKEYAKNNVHLVYLRSMEPVIYVGKTPIRTLDDFKGKKIRAAGSQAQVFSLLGANPVSMDLTAVYSAIQSGVLDGASGFSFSSIYPNRYQEVAKYAVDLGMGVASVPLVVMNLNTWNSLPADVQATMTNTAATLLPKNFVASYNTTNRQQLDLLMKEGIVMTTLPADQVEKMKNLVVTPIKTKWIADMTAAGLSGADFLSQLTTNVDKRTLAGSVYQNPFETYNQLKK